MLDYHRDMAIAPSFDIEAARAFLREKGERRARGLADRRARAEADFAKIVEHIGRVYSPKRILQWGSLLPGGDVSEVSDIDIGLEGLEDAAQYFAILGDAMKMTDFPLDIVEVDKLNEAAAAHIRRTGRVVYERDNPDPPRDSH
ncbi:MAG: hypothetical protein EA403_00430 [Spirochaetaceae bacterium]|nr:MAG: hypothetical protein EA403_00430 [Spirochaetaceae bacterium]